VSGVVWNRRVARGGRVVHSCGVGSAWLAGG
jgi:hypothetical protein